MCLSFKCYCLCLTEWTFIKVLKINTQTNIHCGSVTPTFYDFKIMGRVSVPEPLSDDTDSGNALRQLLPHLLRQPPTGLPRGWGAFRGSFSSYLHGTTTSTSFFWPVPFFDHPSPNVCLLKDLSTKGITFSPERRLLIEKILCSLSLSWLFWGMFLIHDAGRREIYPVKAQF